MTETFDSFLAAKITNPNSEVYKLIGVNEFVSGADLGDQVRIHSRDNDAVKCNPADYCMTVEQFLKAGHKFVAGDFVVECEGVVSKISAGGAGSIAKKRINSSISVAAESPINLI